MPTIDQLPAATQTSSADTLPVSQSGITRSVTVSELFAGLQPALTLAPSTLLGRASVGPGGPEPVQTGLGLALTGGTLSATGADHASYPEQPTLTTTDEVVLNSGGMPRRMPLSLLRGLFAAGSNVTIDANGTISATGSGTSTVTAASLLTGTGAPSSGTGNNGDSYLNLTSGELFQKAAGAWTDSGLALLPSNGSTLSGSADSLVGFDANDTPTTFTKVQAQQLLVIDQVGFPSVNWFALPTSGQVITMVAPYPLSIAGAWSGQVSGGGAFTIAVSVGGTVVPGLGSVSVSGTALTTTNATAPLAVSRGQVISLTVANPTGTLTGGILQIFGTRG